MAELNDYSKTGMLLCECCGSEGVCGWVGTFVVCLPCFGGPAVTPEALAALPRQSTEPTAANRAAASVVLDPPRVSTFQSWRKFQPDVAGEPHGWIQWKGTNVCMDFRCKCGAHTHVDADFTYYLRCGACGQVYELSGHVEVRAIDAVPKGSCAPVETAVDE